MLLQGPAFWHIEHKLTFWVQVERGIPLPDALVKPSALDPVDKTSVCYGTGWGRFSLSDPTK